MARRDVLFAKVTNLGAATDTAIVAAKTGMRIRVLGAQFSAGAASSTAVLTTKPAGAGTAITGVVNMAINGGHVWPANDIGYCQTAAGEGLSVTTTGTGPTEVTVQYALVPA